VTDDSTMGAGYADGQETSSGDRGHGTRLGRRRLMLGAAAAGAGAVAGLAAADPAGAADGGPVLLGESNKATATTTIINKKANTFEASYTGTDEVAVGVLGTSTTGYGVTGQTTGFNAGVGGVATGEGASGVYG
jgi:hypothetical protein